MKQEFLTPVGRLVQGDPFEAQTKNMQGQPLMTQSGQPTQRYFIAVAFPKTINGQPNAEFAALWQKLEATGRAAFPGLNLVGPWDPACRFSWKVMDGDGVDDNGKPNSNKEGFAGHWVVKFSSSFAPRCFHAGHYAPHEQIQDPKLIKRGYFVRVAGTVEGNGNAQKPGIYVNLSMAELAGQGPEIVSGPDAASIFGGNPVGQLPAGATPLPMHAAQPGGLPGSLPPSGGMVAGHGLPGQMPAQALPGQMPGMQPQGMTVQPHAGILGNAQPLGGGSPAGVVQGGLPMGGMTILPGGPAQGAGLMMSPSNPGGLPGMQPMMQQPVVPQLTPAGQATGMTYQQMIAQGYNDAQLRQGGYIV